MLSPGIDQGKDERARAEAQQLAQIRAEQPRARCAPRRGRGRAAATGLAAAGAPAAAQIAGRADALDQLSTAILRDARTRGLPGRHHARGVRAVPAHRRGERGAEATWARRSGRYSCIAVTADVRGAESQGNGIIGHPYRALIDFQTGEYAFCKISGRPGEGSLSREHAIGVPAACGGR